MPDCPTDLQLALFLDGAMGEAEATRFRSHLASCPECSELVADALTLRALEHVDRLPLLTADESARLSTRVSAVPKAPNDPPRPKAPSFLRRLEDALPIGVVASALADLMPKPGPSPSFAGRDENNSDPSVRNHPRNDSISSEGNHAEHPMALPNEGPHIQHAPTLIGLPGMDGQSPEVQQTHPDTCAIRSQELVLRDFGIRISEDDLCREAVRHGWYTPGAGTLPQHVGDLLELHGVPVNRYHDANIFTLTSELAKGHKVIIGVASEELWPGSVWDDLLHPHHSHGADHALIVSGIDTSDIDNVKVVLTDPGSGDIAKSYPMDQFIDAWKDSRCFMVATREPAPPALPAMAHFDYSLGHLRTIGQLPYDDFVRTYLDEDPFHTSVDHDPDSFAHRVAGLHRDDSSLSDGDHHSLPAHDDPDSSSTHPTLSAADPDEHLHPGSTDDPHPGSTDDLEA